MIGPLSRLADRPHPASTSEPGFFMSGVTMTAPLHIGIDLSALYLRLELLEANLMATAAEQIDALSAKIDAQTALIADVHADFTALLAAVNAERENLTAAGQAALDAANAKADASAAALAELDAEVGDADGSDTPEAPAEG